MTFETQADLNRAVRALVKRDPRLAPVVALTGMPALRRREPGFAGLARIITGQQVSTIAAEAIWSRLTAAFDPFSAERIQRATPARLGKLGLSAAKIRTLKAIAKEIRDGELDLEALAALDADAAHARLTALHGVGPWTADVYSPLLPRPSRRMARRRSRDPGGHPHRIEVRRAADDEGDDRARRCVASVPRGRGASLVGGRARDAR